MDRRTFLGTLAGGLLAAPLAAEAEQVSLLGWLHPNTLNSPVDSHITEAFRQGLRELGYVEGRNLRIEYRFAEGHFDRLPALAAELVSLRVDVIFAQSTKGALAAKKATGTIPIVGVAQDPVGLGLVRTLARPEGNFTGLTLMSPEPGAKRMQMLRELLPRLTNVAILVSPTTAASVLNEIETSAKRLALKVQTVEVGSPDNLEGAFSALMRPRPGALVIASDTIFFNNRQRLCELALKHRLPTMTQEKEHAEASCLIAYGTNIADLYRRAAIYVDKILKGAKPADLPVEQPTTFELVINLKTAKALGLTIPQSLLQRADQVIE